MLGEKAMKKFDKAAFELTVFQEFSKLVGLNVDEGAIWQLPPPNPDICCSVDGVERRFELTLITDPTIERKVRTSTSFYSNFKIEIHDLVERIRSKADKAYQFGSVIELVLHEGATPIDDLWLYDQHALNESMEMATRESQFGRIWLVDFSNEKYRVYPSSYSTS
jgi:hypothetical protein